MNMVHVPKKKFTYRIHYDTAKSELKSVLFLHGKFVLYFSRAGKTFQVFIAYGFNNLVITAAFYRFMEKIARQRKRKKQRKSPKECQTRILQ